MKLFLIFGIAAHLWAGNSINLHRLIPGYPKTQTIDYPFSVANEIPPRLQWDQNFGYCGETTFVEAGLYYGQYCSQYTARALASPGIPQYLENSQLLLEANADVAAQAMHLEIEKYESSMMTTDFLVWMKQHVASGVPVIIAVWNNEYLCYGVSNPNAGDPDYDHIVQVYGIGSNHPIDPMDDTYYPDDSFYMTDNGLFYPYAGNSPYYYNYQFGSCQLSRQEANHPSGPIYSINNEANLAVAITGVIDMDGVTVPVTLTPSVNYEIPEIVQGAHRANPPPQSNDPPNPIPITLTIDVTVDNGTEYYLYYYDDFANIPDANFNSSPYTMRFSIPMGSGPTFTMTMDIMSNEMAAFRAVPTSAP